jgi:hypothetical protein
MRQNTRVIIRIVNKNSITLIGIKPIGHITHITIKIPKTIPQIIIQSGTVILTTRIIIVTRNGIITHGIKAMDTNLIHIPTINIMIPNQIIVIHGIIITRTRVITIGAIIIMNRNRLVTT